jgi:hypothetical protein
MYWCVILLPPDTISSELLNAAITDATICEHFHIRHAVHAF